MPSIIVLVTLRLRLRLAIWMANTEVISSLQIGGMIYLVLFNNGDGTFANGVNYGAGDKPASIAIGDIDNDLDIDLAIANTGSDNVSILRNNGDGTFSNQVIYGADRSPQAIAIADLDGDSDLDLAVANQFSNNVRVLKNLGGGSFVNGGDFDTGNRPRTLRPAISTMILMSILPLPTGVPMTYQC